MLANSNYRRRDTRLFVGNVAVTNEQISISGKPAALELALAYGDQTSLPSVSRSDPECTACVT